MLIIVILQYRRRAENIFNALMEKKEQRRTL